MSDYRDSIDVLLLGITCDNIPDVCYFRESGMLNFLDPEEREGGVVLGYGETSYLGDVGAERSAVEEGSTRGSEDCDMPEMDISVIPTYDATSHSQSPDNGDTEDRSYRELIGFNGKPNIDLVAIPPHTPGLTDEDGWERISEESTDTWSTDVQFGEEGLIDRLKELFSVWMTFLKIGSVRGVGRPG